VELVSSISADITNNSSEAMARAPTRRVYAQGLFYRAD
jgi:hypothetical protein